MSRQSGKKDTRVERAGLRLMLGLTAVGSLCVLVSFWFTVSWVARTLSPDGWVSTTLAHRIEWLQWGALLIGAACVMLAGAMTKRAWAQVAAVGLSLCAAAAFVNTFYPRHLLFTPRRLAGAVLGRELLLRDFTPDPSLRVAAHEVLRARYPAINIHAHFSFPGPGTVKGAEALTAMMDACNVAQAVDLDGGLRELFQREMDRYARKAPGRLMVFAHVWFGEDIPGPKFFQDLPDALEEAKRTGASGIKIWKNLGLKARDKQGRALPIDDLRLEPVWEKAAALDLPVLIHLSDPEPFFHPSSARNERFEELAIHPEASLADPRYPRPTQLYEQFERVLDRHPKVTFIGAHMLMLGHDLETLGGILDRHPNLSVDLSAQANELGRQPFTARAFFLKYADRILFGTDGNPDEEVYRQYFRFLETADEYFEYPYQSRYSAGRWKIYGLSLPDDVLRKIYHDNAAKILGLPATSRETHE